MVISHERSGTHFLMNTIAGNYTYLSDPWLNLDFDLPLNFYASYGLKQYFKKFENASILNIFKSHHTAGFFEDIIDYVAEQFHVFYIFRDPRNCLISNWRLIKSLRWDEGPKLASASEFIRAEPSGAMMRYQKKQERNMLQRWQTHVQGWHELSEKHPNIKLCLLSYEELDQNFEATIRKISSFLGQQNHSLLRPDIDKNVVGLHGKKSTNFRDYFDQKDLDFVAKEVGNFMAKINYL
ncbi:MAG: hypothetical protein HON94_16850 [Methylococcales bacterium]|nr:hypothetical protein [Methylococcales bacterium]